MVVKAAKVHDVGYYTSGSKAGTGKEAVPNYYTSGTEHGDPPGRWSGVLAADLELPATVQDGQMDTIYGTFTAPDGTRLGSAPGKWTPVEERVESALADLPVDALPEERARVERDARRSANRANLGLDLTASPEKSYTMAHLALWRQEVESTQSGDSTQAEHFRELRTRLESCLWDANNAMVEYTSQNLVSPLGRHSSTTTGRFISAPDALVASFHQHTNREGDAQEHIHNVFMNRVRGVDGKYRGIELGDAMLQRWAGSAVFHRVLSERLADEGILSAVRPDGVAREVVGIPQDMIDVTSQRRQAISKAVRPAVERWEERYGRPPTGYELSKLKQEANLRTRGPKTLENSSPDLMIERAQARLTSELGTGLLPVATRIELAMANGPIQRSTEFSPDAVCEEAVAVTASKYATWTQANLMCELESRLPLMGVSTKDTGEFLEQLTDYAIDQYAVQVSGHVGITPPENLIEGSYVRPTDVLYAAPYTLEAEDRIRQAAIERGRQHLPAANVNAWLDEHYPSIGADQRAAVVGIASSDAYLTRIIGPAGCGKSYAAGALAGAWEAGTGGKLHGLAVAEVAARNLRDDGVTHSANIDAWLTSQEILASGQGIRDVDQERAVGPNDLILVDEASMADTTRFTRVLQVAKDAGIGVVPMGDHRQLTSVGAGGVMGLVDDVAETYGLTELRRFTNKWEAEASRRLRDGDVSVLDEYERHGRLISANTVDEAIAITARGAAADRLAGIDSVVVTDTNEVAARVANAIREHLVDAGVVDEDGSVLGRTGSTVGAGDQIMTRRNDYDLGVINRDVFEVIVVGGNGSLSVRAGDGTIRELPADYVDEHAHLAYASTAHSAQGLTVDRGYSLITGDAISPEQNYVAASRGREYNQIVVATGIAQDGAPYTREPTNERTARDVLTEILERGPTSKAATISLREDEARLNNMGVIMGRIEDGTRAACRMRMEGDLDRLVEGGVLSMDDRVELASDESSEHLSRLLRATEQAGHDPAKVLRAALEAGSLDGSRSVAQVLSSRITSTHDIRASVPGSVAPERLSAVDSQYLSDWQSQAADRTRELGTAAAQEAPEWATRYLGSVPEDAMERLEWETKAGRIAAHREATGFDDAQRAIPFRPGLTSTEKRESWERAFEALGRPDEIRAEAAMSDGLLRARVTAWEREQQWAPPHADPSLRHSELHAETARQEAILAKAAGEHEAAKRWDAEAERHSTIARGMTTVADARSAWANETAVTRDLAGRAKAELADRGVELGAEPDRISAEEWMAEHQRHMAVEDEHRVVTERDVSLQADTASTPAPSWEWAATPGGAGDQRSWSSPAQTTAAIDPDAVDLEAMVRTAREADDRLEDRVSAEASSAWETDTDIAEFDGPDLGFDVTGVAEAAVPVMSGWPIKPWPDED